MDPQDNNNPKTDNTTPSTADADVATPAVDNPNEQATGAVDLNDLSDASDPTSVETLTTPQDTTGGVDAGNLSGDATAPAPSIDNDPNITIDSSDEPPQEPDSPKPLDVKPAAPMPGSIGSATSGPAQGDQPVADLDDSESSPIETSTMPTDTDAPDNKDADNLVAEAAATPAPMPEQPTPAAVAPINKPHRSTTILSIALIILLVIACVVLSIMLVQANQKANENAKSQQQAPTSSTSSVATLVCAADVTAKQPESLQPLKKAQNTRSFSYKDQEFSELTDVTQYTFEDAAVATTQLEALKTTYKNAYTTAGMTQDPFTTEFSMNDSIVKASHMIAAGDLNAKNAALIGLTADSDGKINTEQNAVKKSLEAEGYICAAGEVNTTENK